MKASTRKAISESRKEAYSSEFRRRAKEQGISLTQLAKNDFLTSLAFMSDADREKMLSLLRERGKDWEGGVHPFFKERLVFDSKKKRSRFQQEKNPWRT